MRYPGRGPGILGPRYGRWGVDLAPPCHAPDAAGSCPNCFSHDDPNDPARAPGKGPKAWWDNSSCRNPEFRLPDLGGPGGLSLPQLNDRPGNTSGVRIDETHRPHRTEPQRLAAAARQFFDRKTGFEVLRLFEFV